MRLIKKAVCILVIFALVVSVVPTTASASALTVVGTSFSSAGLTSAEFAASAGPYAIGILAALAAAYGIKAFTQTETGQSVKEFFGGLIENRAAATRRSVAEQMEALLGNATIDEDGNINIGRLSFAEARETLLQDEIPISRPTPNIYLGEFVFGNSLNYIYDSPWNGSQVVYYIDSKTSVNNNMFFETKTGSTSTISKCFFVPYDSNINPRKLYREDIYTGHVDIYQYPYPNRQITVGQQIYALYELGDITPSCPYAPFNNYQEFISGTYTGDDLLIDYPSDTLYGVDETLRGQNVGLTEGLILAPDLINSAVLGGAAGQISASDYCGVLVDYVSGYDTVIDGVTLTGLPEAGTVPRSIDEAPTSDTVIDEAPPSTMTGVEAAGLYSFSLDELFPFCLPFDFVRIIEKFNVEPEAPNFDWRFYIPGVIDYTLHIDLSAWNTAAEVCRTMVLIAFMVGIIMLTRQIFIRA